MDIGTQPAVGVAVTEAFQEEGVDQALAGEAMVARKQIIVLLMITGEDVLETLLKRTFSLRARFTWVAAEDQVHRFFQIRWQPKGVMAEES